MFRVCTTLHMHVLSSFCEEHVRRICLIPCITMRIKNFHQENESIQYMAKLTRNTKFRRRNFPEDVSETMVRLILWKKYGIMPIQNKTGDLLYLSTNIEVKTFISKGPSSFGPKESWDEIFFLDLTKLDNTETKTRVILYKVCLSMESPAWQNIKVNKNETMGDQQRAKRRPRIDFYSIKKQLPPEHVRVEYDGYFEDLF